MLEELLTYDPVHGKLYIKKSNRPVSPDEQNSVVVYDATSRKRYRIKFSRVCWELGNAKTLPSSHRILHKNLDENDFRLSNLVALPRNTYNKVQEAIRNLNGHLKIQPHPHDQYSYIISYQLNNINMKEIKHDIVSARQLYTKLQLKFAKILNKYCIFD